MNTELERWQHELSDSHASIGPEFRSSVSMYMPRCVIHVFPVLRRWGQDPWSKWLARLAGSVNSGFKRETLPQYIRRRKFKEDTQHQPLATAWTRTHICEPTHVNTPTDTWEKYH